MKKNLLTQKLIATKQHFNRDMFCIDVRAQVGLFAQINWCLYILMHCKEHKIKPSIKLSSPFYSNNHENYLPKLLKEKQPQPQQKLRYSIIEHLHQLPIKQGYGNNLDLKTAHNIFFEYFDINADIKNYVDTFASENFDENTLAVHLRGTDKILEAEKKPDDYIIRRLKENIEKNQIKSIFLATDEDKYITLINNNFKSINIIIHPDTQRSINGEPIHRSSQKVDKSQIAAEAMINALLLSKCNHLVKTASFLSSWSCVFNPKINVSMLNKPNKNSLWFPDIAII